MKHILTLIFVLNSIFSSAQELNLQWAHRFEASSYDGDRSHDVTYDNSGNIITAGYVNNRCTGTDMIIAKYNSNGQQLWRNEYAGLADYDDEDIAVAVKVDQQDNIYVTGISEDANYNYIATIKYSPTGSQLWAQRYTASVSEPSSMSVDDSGNVYVCGFEEISNDENILLIKYNTSGVQQWVKSYSSGFGDRGLDVKVDNNGSVYVTGQIFVTGNSYDWVTIKYSSGGVQQWANPYTNLAGPYVDYPVRLVLDASGNIYVTGYSDNTSTTNSDIITIKYNPSGGTEWTTPWSGPNANSTDEPKDMVVDNAGNVFIAAAAYGLGSAADIVTLKFNPDGNFVWEARVDSSQEMEYIRSIVIDSTGLNIYTISDITKDNDPYMGRDVFILHYDTSGNELHRKGINGDGNGFDLAFATKINAAGELIMAGVSSRSSYDTDATVWKTNSQLDSLWVTYENGHSYVDDVGNDFYVDAAGNSYVCGNHISFNSKEDVSVFKLNTSGQREWKYEWTGFKEDGSETAMFLAVDASGNVYVTGTMDTSVSQNNKDIYVMKLDANGELVWRSYYGGTANGDDEPKGIKINPAGNIIVAGNTVNTGTGADGIALCYDNSGNQLWATPYNGNSLGDGFLAFDLDANSNLIAAGYLISLSGSTDGLIVKYNSNGSIAWDSTYNNTTGNGYDFFNCIAIDGNGNAFAAGQSSLNWVTAKFSPSGNLEWVQNYSYSNNMDSVTAIIIDNDNNVIVGGTFGQFSEQDFGIIKYRNDSTQVWVQRFANSAGSDDILTYLAVDDTNNIYAAGWETQTYTTNYQYMLLKYDSAGALEYDVIWTDSNAVAPDYGKKIGFDDDGNIYFMGDASDHCFGNMFVNGFRWDIQVLKYGYGSGVGLANQSVSENEILAYPNPAKNEFRIVLTDEFQKNKPVHITLYDINGKIIRHEIKNDFDISISTEGISNGMIFWTVEQNLIRKTGKILIQK